LETDIHQKTIEDQMLNKPYSVNNLLWQF